MGDPEPTSPTPRTIPPFDQGSELESTLAGGSHSPTIDPSDEPTLGVEAAPRPSRRDMPVIPGYEILGELGRGGMGIVYLGRQVRLNRSCAIKMVLGGSQASPESVLRFLAEAEAVAKLQHLNVVQIHHIGEADGLPYLELEYVEGGSLASAIDGTPWHARRATALVEPLVLAMAEAHSHGLVHRDLKPSNILLTPDGTPKIIDFGLAKSLDVDINLTQTDSILGSPCYMAPEQAEGKHHEIGPPADLYALGVILYELLTGRPPFKGASVLETLEQVKTTEPVSPRRMVPGLPADLETICLKCLQKEPSKRYESTSALAEDLRRFRAGEPIVARPVGSIDRTWRWCRRNPSLAGLVGLVLVLLMTMLAGASWGLVHFKDQFERLRREQENTAQAEKQRLETLERSLWSTQPDGVPIIIKELGSARSRFLPALRDAFRDGDPGRRLRAAVALTMLGEDHSAFLIAQIPTAPASESRNIILALASTDPAGLGPLMDGFRADHPPAIRSRFASTLLSCGDPAAARSMLRLDADPMPRAAFIHHFEDWHGDLASLPSVMLEGDDPDLRSGLCAAIARIGPDRLTSEERPALKAACLALYRESSEAGTHEAAGTALRNWGVGLPAEAPSREGASGHGWFVNQSGMTMIGVPEGIIPTRRVAMLPYLMSAREVTFGLFRQFLDDPSTPAADKPGDLSLPDIGSAPGSAAEDPIGFVSSDDAVLFCNWLSRREGRLPCYVRSAGSPDAPFRCLFGADGYRLPTRSEWEYAARAGASTRTAFGDRTEYVADYANLAGDQPEPAGSRLPNGWGFYDLLGNVWERVWGMDEQFTAKTAHPSNPVQGDSGMILGSAYGGGTWQVNFDRFYAYHVGQRNPTGEPVYGFRVVCVDDPRTRALLAADGPRRRELELREWLRYDPGDGEAHRSLGDALRDTGHPDRASSAYREAARLRPDDPEAHARLGLALSLTDDREGAANAYRAAILASARADRIGAESVFLDVARRDPWLHDIAVEHLLTDRNNDRLSNYLRALFYSAYGPDREAYRLACLELFRASQGPSSDDQLAGGTVRACSLSPDPAVDPARMVAVAERLADLKAGWYPYVLGMAYYRAGRYEEAIRSLERSSEVEPGWHAKALNWPVLAMAHHRLGHAREARRWLEAADRAIIPSEPFWNDPVELGLLRDEARALIRGTIAPADRDSVDPIRSAEFLGRVGRHDAAVGMYLEAARSRPFEDITASLYRTGRIEEALVVCRELTRLRPESALAHEYLGYALLESKRPDEAIEELREAIRHDPQYLPSYRNLLRALPLVDNLDRAGDLLDVVEAATSNAPELLRLKNTLARRLVAGPKPWSNPAAVDRAVRLARAVVAAKPANGDYRNTLGVALARSGRWEAAIFELDESVRLSGDDSYAFNGFFLAISHWHLGHESLARSYLDRSVEWVKQHAPDDPALGGFRSEAEALFRLDIDFPTDPFRRREIGRE